MAEEQRVTEFKMHQFQLWDLVKVTNPKDANRRWLNCTGQVRDRNDYCVSVDFGERAPKNRNHKAMLIRLGPDELTLINRPEASKSKKLHECGSYRQFSLETYDPAVGEGVNAIAFWWNDSSVKLAGHYQDLTPKEVWEDMIEKIDALIQEQGLDIPPVVKNEPTPTNQRNTNSMLSSYNISAMCREQVGGLRIYSASVPFQFVAQMFGFYDSKLPPEQRAQRELDTRHARKIKDYLLSSRPYYLPPMIVAIEGDKILFKPFSQDVNNGLLKLPMNSTFLVVDGQHRTVAIREILQDEFLKTEFGNQLISVDFLHNPSLEMCQKIFREVNSLQRTVSKNLTTVYSEDTSARLVAEVLRSISIFSDQYVEKDKNSLGIKSPKLFVYKSLYTATAKICQNVNGTWEEKKVFAETFWSTLVQAVPEWCGVLTGSITPAQVRENTISTHNVTIQALGELGKFMSQISLEKAQKNLSRMNVDWSRTNPDWHNRVIDPNSGNILARRQNIKLLLIYLKAKCGAPNSAFSQDERELEQQLTNKIIFYS